MVILINLNKIVFHIKYIWSRLKRNSYMGKALYDTLNKNNKNGHIHEDT